MTSPYGDPKDYPRPDSNGPYALGGFVGRGRRMGIVDKLTRWVRTVTGR